MEHRSNSFCDSQEILRKTRTKTFHLVLATVAFTIGLNLLVYYLATLNYEFQVEVMWFGLAVCLGLMAVERTSVDLKYSYWIFNLFMLVFLPLRYIVPGGAQAALIFGFMAHSVFVFGMSGRKFGLLTLLWSCAVLSFLQALVTERDFSDGPFAVAIVVLLLFFVAITTIYFVLEGQKLFLKSIRKKEKDLVSDQLLNQLGETIEGLVALARKDVRQTLQDKNYERMATVERVCESIDRAIKTISNTSDENKINSEIQRLREERRTMES